MINARIKGVFSLSALYEKLLNKHIKRPSIYFSDFENSYKKLWIQKLGGFI